MRHLLALIVCWCALPASGYAQSQEPLRLENGRIGLSFDRKTGTLAAIENKLAGETYEVRGDECGIDAVEFRTAFADLKLASLERQGEAVKVRYQGGGITVDVAYTLHGENHFAEKRLTLTCDRNYGLKKVVVSRLTFSGPSLQLVPYRYSKHQRAPGTEPNCTFFGRTVKGGFFAGLEMPFDASSVKQSEVVLQFAPSLKVAAGAKVAFEPAYFGVYRRGPYDRQQPDAPLRSESDAMVAMTSDKLGPARFGLVPMVNGWGSEMEHGEYTAESAAADMKSLALVARCGIDWYTEPHPWAGEWAKVGALGQHDNYRCGPLDRKVAAHARQLGVKSVMFSTLNNTYPWIAAGRPFRADRPDWLIDAGSSPPATAPDWRKEFKGNCLGDRAFWDWLERTNLQAIAECGYRGWGIDGDFFGGPGMPAYVVPADCQSDKHDHLPGDSNYACQRALDWLTAAFRRQHPRIYISVYRPQMDLGIWSLQNVDACFTLNESGTPSDNLAGGNGIRTWSRIRVHRDFLPHYIDQPLLFPDAGPGKWSGKRMDYILLSALSSSPNQLYYLPTRSGLPEQDQAELRKWLDWGRKNIECLKVRKDLPDWPGADRVDGSAHVVGGRGLICLFNPSPKALTGEFALTEESIGLKATGNFQVSQEYPAVDRKIASASGQTVRWEVPPTTAVVLRIECITP
jgi:hypothetical protein